MAHPVGSFILLGREVVITWKLWNYENHLQWTQLSVENYLLVVLRVSKIAASKEARKQARIFQGPTQGRTWWWPRRPPQPRPPSPPSPPGFTPSLLSLHSSSWEERARGTNRKSSASKKSFAACCVVDCRIKLRKRYVVASVVKHIGFGYIQ